jgi:hypothetical protein
VKDSENIGARITEIGVAVAKRYGERNFEDLFAISGKWLGVYLEIFLKTRGLLRNLWTAG